ncbi:MAG: AI-2E family transporter [Rhodobacteraceae bacterium]|nr:AI-2E family transporter [Paracoccaceae bacterium]
MPDPEPPEPAERPAAGLSVPRNHGERAIDVAVRLAVLAGFLGLVIALIRPYFGLLVWSAILTVALYPLFAWLRDRLGGRSHLAAILVTLLALVVVFGPAALLVSSVVVSLEGLAAAVHDGTLALPPLPAAIENLPLVGATLKSLWTNGMAGAEALLRAHGDALVGPGKTVLQIIAGLAGSVAVFAVAVVVAGFLFVPGPRIVAVVREAAHKIAGPRGDRFIALGGATVRSVARGIIGIAMLQSLLMGSAMIVADIPHAGLLTLAVLIVSLAQIAAAFVAVPVTIWVWFAHGSVFAIVFSLVFLPLGVMEIPLKPLAMGQGLDTPMIVIVAGVAGGMVAFGLPGLFLGPLVLSLAWEMLAYWLAETGAGRGAE